MAREQTGSEIVSGSAHHEALKQMTDGRGPGPALTPAWMRSGPASICSRSRQADAASGGQLRPGTPNPAFFATHCFSLKESPYGYEMSKNKKGSLSQSGVGALRPAPVSTRHSATGTAAKRSAGGTAFGNLEHEQFPNRF